MPSPTISPNRGYNYKKPRKINLVSTVLILIAVGGAYSAWKFGPIYWKKYKVEEVLGSAKSAAEGTRIDRLNPAGQSKEEDRIVEVATNHIIELGITPEEHGLQVYFTEGYRSINADYTVIVQHPFGKSTKLDFRLRANIRSSKDF